jgi:hypothetical protein
MLRLTTDQLSSGTSPAALLAYRVPLPETSAAFFRARQLLPKLDTYSPQLPILLNILSHIIFDATNPIRHRFTAAPHRFPPAAAISNPACTLDIILIHTYYCTPPASSRSGHLI